MSDDGALALLLLALAGGGLLLRLALPRVRQWRALALLALVTTALAIACAVGGVLTWVERDMRGAIGSLPFSRTGAQVSAALGSSRIVIAGRVSEDNPGQPYPAYIEKSDLAGDDSDSYEYRLNDLIVTLDDGSTVVIDRDTYEPRNWHVTSEPLREWTFLRVGDDVVASGYPYEPWRAADRINKAGRPRLYLQGDIVFRGNSDDAQTLLVPQLAGEARRLHYTGLVSVLWALVLLLAPLTRLPHLWRQRATLSNGST